MSFFETVRIDTSDSLAFDLLGRTNSASPVTLFDSKQIHDAQVKFFDDAEVSGSGTSSAHQTNKAGTLISVSNATAGKRVRQTFESFNYQPGKVQEFEFTMTDFDASTGITKEVGCFSDTNGFFLRNEEGSISFVNRSYVTGSVVDTEIARASWIDPLDGSGKSLVNYDPSKFNIIKISYVWLGGAIARLEIFHSDHGFIKVAEFSAANTGTSVFTSTSNFPIRYSIENDGTGAADSFLHICSGVVTNGGQDDTGIPQNASTGGTHVDANTADTVYAVLGIRLKSTYLDMGIRMKKMSMISETNDDFEWLLYLNPTVAGTFTYVDNTNSYVQIAKGATANTVTGGFSLGGDVVKSSASTTQLLTTVRNLGAAIDGTPDELVLCVRPFSSNADIQATLTWLELT